MRHRLALRRPRSAGIPVATVLPLWLALASAWPAAALPAQSPSFEIQGQVVDTSGAPVPDASVTLEVAGVPVAETTTGGDGSFALEGRGDNPALRAGAPGFADTIHPVAAAGGRGVRIVLHPASFVDSVTVTGSRGAERLDSPAGTTVIGSAALLNSAAGALDDALRNTPGFSLFRRSSSRVANPTTQGVTLRGVSGSGASRTLVLADGFALNDPFGSWVYWNRVPQAAIDRVEVVRGAAGDLYGADALGGIVQLLTFAPTRPRLRASVDGGSHETARVSLFASGRRGAWVGAASGEWLTTEGVEIVADEDAGTVDVPADSDYRTAFATGGYDAGSWQARGRASIYGEDRGNGTPRQINDTYWRQFSGDASGTAAGGAWRAQAAGGTQDYFQTFTAIAADRLSERPTTEQRIPSSFWTYGGQWAQPWRAHVFLIGAEGKHTESTVRETRFAFVGGAPSGPFLAGGTEKSGSIFGRVSLSAGSGLTIGLGARGDFWRSDPRDEASPAHAVNFFSPRGSVTWRASDVVSIHGSAYRAYRTPTLNELHRGFRVGNIVTNPNPVLEPERLTGVEGGILLAGRRTSTRVTAFWNVLDDAIANITQSVTPAQITRQRQNADRVRAAGMEVEADFRLDAALTVTALAALTSSIFDTTPGQPAIEGNRIPQVPRYQLGAGVTWVGPSAVTLSSQLRIVGAQFDDDQNELELGEFAVVDAYASRALVRGLQAFVAVENLFDTEYDVGRTPVRTVGWPRTIRGGLRVFLP